MCFSHFLGVGGMILDKTNVFIKLSAWIIGKEAVNNLTSVIGYNRRGTADSLETWKGERDKLIKGWEEGLKDSETQAEIWRISKS